MDGKAGNLTMDVPRTRLRAEAALLYVLLPAGLCLVRLDHPHVPVLPVLWLAGLLAGCWLVRHGFRAADFFGWRGLAACWRGVLIRVAIACVLLAGAVLWIAPDWFFELPRQRTGLWVLIVCLYPILSVYPQGIVYRALYYRRYAVLWSSPLLARLAGAVAFSLAHMVFMNPWALALTFAGGWFFNRTYERTQSLPVSNLEHALCGVAVFTIGLGRFFYHGTQALLQAL